MPLLLLNHPDTIREVVVSRAPKSIFYKFIEPWLGLGLLTNNHDVHSFHREVLRQGFTPQQLKGYIPTFEKNALELIDHFKTMLDVQGQVGMNIEPYLHGYTLDSVCKLAFGYDVPSVTNPNNEYVKTIHDLCELFWKRCFAPWFFPDRLYQASANGKRYHEAASYMHSLADDIIATRAKQRNTATSANVNFGDATTVAQEKSQPLNVTQCPVMGAGGVNADLLDIMLGCSSRSGQKLSPAEIRDEVNTFVQAGHDTTALTLAYAIYLMAEHPEWQEKAREEIHASGVFGAAWLGMDEADKLKSLSHDLSVVERCLKETLRLYPPVPILSRVINGGSKGGVEVDGHFLPNDTPVAVCPYVIHRMEEFWPNAETFDPDRFLPSVKHNIYSYIPFSVGSRGCLGQKFAMLEMKVFIAALLREFDVVREAGSPPVSLLPEMVMRPMNGIHISLRRRKAVAM